VDVPEETRDRLAAWCAAAVPDAETDRRRLGVTVQGGEVTVLDRRRPVYPELDVAWSSTPLALLRLADDGGWTLHRPAGEGWEPVARGADPVALLESVTV
jgi:hypothetical protein